MTKRAFTLIELIVTLIIIGILAVLAFPQFSKTKEHAIGKEAIANLKLIAAAEKIYRIEANTYISESNISNINTDLKLFLPSTSNRNWDYSVTGAASTFNSTATRLSTDPNYSKCRYSIDNTIDEPTPNNTTYCP